MSGSTVVPEAQNLESRPAPPTVPPLGSERFRVVASEDRLARALQHLEGNGFRVLVVGSKDAARKAVEEILPPGAEVLNSTSETLTVTGIEALVVDSGKYRPIRPEMMRLREAGDRASMRRLGAAPDYVVGSVHAVTEEGQVVIASGSGSQLAPYAFGAQHVIWVVGTQKVVANLDVAFQRIYEHSLPLESDRVRRVYGAPQSQVSEILIVNREPQPGRTTIVLVTEALGY
jgi:L-lactate utilization protein LutC